MAQICKKIDVKIVETLSKWLDPIIDWARKCQIRPWYDPRGWFCWLVKVIVKAGQWFNQTVVRWVVRTVCKTVTAIVNLILVIGAGIVEVIIGIFTLDWRRMVDAVIETAIGTILGIIGILRVLVLCDTFDFFRGEFDVAALRRHVATLLDARFTGDPVSYSQVAAHIGLNRGVFGLKLSATAYRTVLDSETSSLTDPSAPNLVVLHEAGKST